MRPVPFKESNHVYAEHQPEYEKFPGLRFDDQLGTFVSCWQLTWKERIKLLLTGKLWMTIMTFNKPLQPHYLSTNKEEHFTENEQETDEKTA